MWSEAVNTGCLAWVDVAFADLILGDLEDIPSKAFLCHLSKCAREGHLCVRVSDGKITPDPVDVWFADLSEPPTKSLLYLVNQVFCFKLPNPVVADVVRGGDIPVSPICRHGNDYYFQKYWIFESQFLYHYHRICDAMPKLTIDYVVAKKKVDELKEERILNEEQANAVLKALTGSFSIICGGPGTGKTYTAGHFIKLFQELIGDSCEIALAAPTGKAASNLQRSLQNSNRKAQTLHSLLGIGLNRLPLSQTVQKHSKRDSEDGAQKLNQFNDFSDSLTADLILVDECSMIDVRLMSHLFASVKTGARLILLGDPYQLPPVEAGALFTDLIGSFSGVSSLKTCLRAELKEMIDFAACVNSGSVSETLSQLNRGGAVKRLLVDGRSNILKEICQHIPNPDPAGMSPIEILNVYNVYRVLSPLRRGPFGIDEINENIHQLRCKYHARSAPIMIIQNDYRMGLFNGEVGVLIFDPKGAYALFYGTNEVRKIPFMLLPKYEYAYCLSVHKSQGSEFDYVLLLMPEGAEVFGREVLYTAVTRAKKGLQIWGTDNVLTETLERCIKRVSGCLF